jgi:Cft2 family RNA processing exonuclease
MFTIRAQELLLILDEYWHSAPALQSCPVFYASKLASKALRVYQTFINTMNEHIRRQMVSWYYIIIPIHVMIIRYLIYYLF